LTEHYAKSPNDNTDLGSLSDEQLLLSGIAKRDVPAGLDPFIIEASRRLFDPASKENPALWQSRFELWQLLSDEAYRADERAAIELSPDTPPSTPVRQELIDMIQSTPHKQPEDLQDDLDLL
jgi:hypothetical protein